MAYSLPIQRWVVKKQNGYSVTAVPTHPILGRLELLFSGSQQCPIQNEIRDFYRPVRVGGWRATGTDRGSVPKDRLTKATTHTKAVYEVLRRQNIPLEVNGSQNHRYPPEFDELRI
jgi:hypothetical protein